METQAVEDINAVLGRFQAWTGSRNAVEPRPGVRELSDEEALKSGRYKWKGADKARIGKAEATELEPETTSAKSPKANRRAASKATAKEKATKTLAVEKTAAKPAFREVLAQALGRSEIVSPAKHVELARQAAISVRFAPEERTLIKRHAAEAGISTSAYIRQCALEVEQLRTQVQQTLAAMEHGVATSFQSSVPISGFLARIARRFFPRSGSAVAFRA